MVSLISFSIHLESTSTKSRKGERERELEMLEGSIVCLASLGFLRSDKIDKWLLGSHSFAPVARMFLHLSVALVLVHPRMNLGLPSRESRSLLCKASCHRAAKPTFTSHQPLRGQPPRSRKISPRRLKIPPRSRKISLRSLKISEAVSTVAKRSSNVNCLVAQHKFPHASHLFSWLMP